MFRPDRLSRWQAGQGRISPDEARTLDLLASNAQAIENLKLKNSTKNPLKVRRAIRDWIQNGKAKDVDYHAQDTDTKERQLRAIRALRYLGIEPSEGTYYVRMRKG